MSDETLGKNSKETILETWFPNKHADNLEQKELHESIKQRGKIAMEGVDEMLENPFTIKQAKAQVDMLNSQSGKRNLISD